MKKLSNDAIKFFEKMGRLGGKSKSKAKLQAIKKNAKLGGRPKGIKNKKRKKLLSLLILFGNIMAHAGDTEKTTYDKTVKCFTYFYNQKSSSEDLIASYGTNTGSDLYEAQENELKLSLINCIRTNKNKCAVKQLDSLIEEKKGQTTVLEILESTDRCTKKPA